jgi:hypothetical protein
MAILATMPSIPKMISCHIQAIQRGCKEKLCCIAFAYSKQAQLSLLKQGIHGITAHCSGKSYLFIPCGIVAVLFQEHGKFSTGRRDKSPFVTVDPKKGPMLINDSAMLHKAFHCFRWRTPDADGFLLRKRR